MREEIVEHAVQCDDGGKYLRAPDPAADYGVGPWIVDMQNCRNKVFQRRIIVVEDWVEIVGESAPIKPVERPRRSVFDTGDVEAYWHSRNNREG